MMQTHSHSSSEMPRLPEMFCTVAEVEQFLHDLEVSKASGPDKISSRMLNMTATSIAPSITELFNLSIHMGKIPDQWKESMVVPIPKSNKLSDPGNYRPISLTCILCKLEEAHVQHVQFMCTKAKKVRAPLQAIL